MRGEFIRGDGLVIPNNVTIAGVQAILALAFQSATQDFYMGMCQGLYSPGMLLSNVVEPTNGVGGYQRQHMLHTTGDWPLVGSLNGESYVESRDFIFAPTGSGFDQSVSRLFIADATTGGRIFMLGGAFPAAIQLLATTPLAQRTFRYRFYLR